MSKFQKLSQLSKDIELLENAGQIRAAEIMHKKFIKEAQYMMPQMMMPQMMMPQMMPMMMPQMMARPAAPMATSAPNRGVSTNAPTTQVSTNQAGQAGQGSPVTPITVPGKPTVTPPVGGGQIQPPYEGSNSNAGGQNVPPVIPPPPPPAGYGNQQNKNNELQYLENELKRLQDLYGDDCGGTGPGGFGQQCNTLREMIKRNKGGSIIKG
jgi:hypothetical protein